MKMRINFTRLSLLCLTALYALYASARERLIILNEGLWQADNGKISYFDNGEVLSNEWFREQNGYKLGDTPNDIIQINDNLIAIAVNWSNIVQFITPEGKAVAATEDVPNNRKLATDGRYVYISSYGHEVAINGEFVEFTRGYVAKIDIETFKVVAAVEVGYEPEGIAYYEGKLFVANTGGYAFQENHNYETTVSVIDAATMKTVRTVDTRVINLYGKMSQSGRYLCINSPGDYYDVMAATVIFDCQAAIDGKPDEECFHKLEYAATYNTVDHDGYFYAIGSRYSYYSGEYEFNYIRVNPALLFDSDGEEGVDEEFPGTVLADIKAMMMPYGIYVNPYSGYMYATDAASFTSAGKLYQWDPEGRLLGTYKLYINPAHFLALPPDGHFGPPNQPSDSDNPDNPGDENSTPAIGIENTTAPLYNLQGLRVSRPIPGHIYIRQGKKILWHLPK